MIETTIAELQHQHSLSQADAYTCITSILQEKHPAPTVAKWLGALSQKGETHEEILGCAQALLNHAKPIHLPSSAIDLCGTGGSGFVRFNISTTAAFVLAAGGVPVIKHGNRGSRRPNGSFDLLDALQCPYAFDAETTQQLFEQTQVCFLFARQYHPAVGKVAEARKLVNARTIFNIIGPLCNPANPKYQIIGTTNRHMAHVLASVLQDMGRSRCLVVVGEPGIDEMSISGPTTVLEVTPDAIQEFQVHPADFGLSLTPYVDIPGGDAPENARLFHQVMQEQRPSVLVDMVCLNAGAAMYCYGAVDSILAGVELSKEMLSKGFAYQKYQEYCQVASQN